MINRERIDSKLESQPSIDSVDKNISSAELIDSLNSIADSLEEINVGLEPQFVKVGECLQAVFFDSGKLEKQTIDAAHLVGKNSDCSIMREINELTRQSIGELQLRQNNTSQSLQTVQSIVKHLQELYPKSKALVKIAKNLRAISICFAVESSRSDDSVEMFAAFTKKMDHLVANVFEITEKIRKDSSIAKNKQSEALDCITEGSNLLQGLLMQADKAVTDASKRIDQIVCMSVSALDEVGKLSGNIAKQISSIVIAIQFHDITRQQVEHIISTLRDEALKLENFNSEDSRCENLNAEMSCAYSVIKLQIAQLKQVIDSIKKSHNAIESSFHEIGRASGKLADTTSLIDAESLEDDSFSNLRSALENLNGLLENGRHLSNTTSDAASNASEASTVLSGHAESIRDINTDIGIQALNAIINSVHLGEKGRVLATLAQEVTQLSGRCSGLVENIVENLEMIIALAKESNNLASSRLDNSTSIKLEAGIKQITKAFSDFRESSISAMKQAEMLETGITDTESELVFLDDVEEQLSSQLHVLDGTLYKLKDYSDPVADCNGIRDVSGYADKYTMKSERDVHLKIVNGGAEDDYPVDDANVQPNVEEASNEEDSNVLGDNVELF